ncbi:hypothetical protein BDB00DRAFT_791767 [Zychaea mexicana]|uniref:uncharacterized protein n=1 Tax=Zychaea mexicana TaxID=64656 RepID=UPI0022FDD2C1|nr:uncharacterized protein BDB00DRAFT_791767 [Zychaea mexicana]KAI9488607.1 hypothetical protein BDB00DRAFT_791767 [Zychaea mexicana]
MAAERGTTRAHILEAASLVLYEDEHEYKVVKMCMMATLNAQSALFINYLGADIVTVLLKKLSRPEGPSPSAQWFDVLYCPRVLAETYNRPVVMFTSQGSSTCLPFREPKLYNGVPLDLPPIAIYLTGLQFYAVLVKEDAIVTVKWPPLFPGHDKFVKNNGLSSAWLDMYLPRCNTN